MKGAIARIVAHLAPRASGRQRTRTPLSASLARVLGAALRPRPARDAPRARRDGRGVRARRAPGARVRGGARRRHERQGLGLRDGRVDRARGREARPASTRRRTSCSFAERIRIDGEPLTDDALEASSRARSRSARSSRSSRPRRSPRSSRSATRKVDVAVIEVGIGGRLDATNVIPRAARRGDHAHRVRPHGQAGRHARRHRAREGRDREAWRPDRRRRRWSRTVRAAIDEVARARRRARSTCARRSGRRRSGGMPSSSVARRPPARQPRRRRRLARRPRLRRRRPSPAGSGATRWPGRLERIETADGTYLLDGAHNPDGAARARPVPRARASPGRRLVFGALADKAWPEMLDILAPEHA